MSPRTIELLDSLLNWSIIFAAGLFMLYLLLGGVFLIIRTVRSDPEALPKDDG